jgi:hypothetical protein
MTIAEQIVQAKEDYDAVYDAGKKAEYDALWDMVLNKRGRTDFEYAFAYWGAEYIRPPMKIVPSNSRSIGMFKDNNSLKKVEAEYFDLSNCNVNDTSTTQGNYMTFARCQYIEEIEDIGMKAGYYYQTYAWCYRLKTIAVVRSNENTMYTDAFRGCNDLENITVEGIIGKDIDFKSCKKLTFASLVNILNHLKDFTGTGEEYTRTLTLSQASVDILNEDTPSWIGSMLGTQKKWNLTIV